jgi:hypothetical protein
MNNYNNKNVNYDKSKCPIVIMLEDIDHPITSRTLKNLLPTLQKNNFKSLALEEMSNRSVKFLINLYALQGINEMLYSKPHQYSSMYSLLKKAEIHEFAINNIDYNEINYLEANYNYLKNQEIILPEANEILEKEYLKTITLLLQNENTPLKQDIASSFFTKDPTLNQFKTLAQYDAQLYFQHPVFLSVMTKTLDDPFIAGRSAHFAKEIDLICQNSQAGVVALLGLYHAKVAKSLKDQGYNVQTYHIKPEQLEGYTDAPEKNLLKYNYDWANEHMFYNSTIFFDLKNQSEELIVSTITEDILHMSGFYHHQEE